MVVEVEVHVESMGLDVGCFYNLSNKGSWGGAHDSTKNATM